MRTEEQGNKQVIGCKYEYPINTINSTPAHTPSLLVLDVIVRLRDNKDVSNEEMTDIICDSLAGTMRDGDVCIYSSLVHASSPQRKRFYELPYKENKK